MLVIDGEVGSKRFVVLKVDLVDQSVAEDLEVWATLNGLDIASGGKASLAQIGTCPDDGTDCALRQQCEQAFYNKVWSLLAYEKAQMVT